MKQQNVQSTAYPNGEVVRYQFGMEKPNPLPITLDDIRYLMRKKNTLKPPRTLIQEAKVIIEMASKKLKTKVNY